MNSAARSSGQTSHHDHAGVHLLEGGEERLGEEGEGVEVLKAEGVGGAGACSERVLGVVVAVGGREAGAVVVEGIAGDGALLLFSR